VLSRCNRFSVGRTQQKISPLIYNALLLADSLERRFSEQVQEESFGVSKAPLCGARARSHRTAPRRRAGWP